MTKNASAPINADARASWRCRTGWGTASGVGGPEEIGVGIDVGGSGGSAKGDGRALLPDDAELSAPA